jgi:tetratricopeptide (TPR) repeat protein
MTKLKFSVVFAVMVCLTGSFPTSARCQMGPAGLGGYCYTCGQFQHPNVNSNSNASGEHSLFQQAFAEGAKGNYEAEVEIYNEIVRINPQSAYAYYDIGQVKKNKLNDRDGAIEAFRIAANIFRQQGNNSMFRDAMEKIQALGG